MMIAQLPQNGLREEVRGRRPPNQKEKWLLSVILNGIIYVNFLKTIENFEKKKLNDDVIFNHFELFSDTKRRFKAEIEAILGASGPESIALSLTLPIELTSITRKHPGFDPVIEI